MKRVLLFILIAFSFTAYSQDEPSHLRFSLITCTSGNDAASAFGHSAIRLTDSVRRMDVVFNYGTFSFEEPHFILKFMHGELDYMLSINNFRSFRESYRRDGRGMSECLLNLTESQKVKLYSFLMDNYKPENRYYRYDFLIDNCATRIRDIFGGDDFIYHDSLTGKTYREELRELYILDKRWFRFGTDILLGALVDKEITSRQEMFLPCNLEKNMARYRNTALSDSVGTDGLLAKSEVLQEPAPEQGSFMKALVFLSQPVIVFSVLAFILLIMFARIRNRHKFVRTASVIFYTVLGLGGVLLVYMWFGTEHIWTKLNWNLLWMNPLFLIPVCLPGGKLRRVMTAIPVVLCIGAVAFQWLIPQYINPAVIPIAVIVSFLLVFEIMINRTNNK